MWSVPFTKVGRSCPGQHDLLFHGPADLAAYDHHMFPGVVPRTFIGAIEVAALAKPVVACCRWSRGRWHAYGRPGG